MEYIESQTILAKHLGVSKDHLSRFKLRKNRISKEKATELCRMLELDMYDLLCLTTRQLDEKFKDFFKLQTAKRMLRERGVA